MTVSPMTLLGKSVLDKSKDRLFGLATKTRSPWAWLVPDGPFALRHLLGPSGGLPQDSLGSRLGCRRRELTTYRARRGNTTLILGPVLKRALHLSAREWIGTVGMTIPALGIVGKLRRRPESEPFFRLAKTAKQAMFVLSSDAAGMRPGRKRAAPSQIESSDTA